MQSLNVSPPLSFVWGALQPVSIALVGCGGTGSHLAQALAKLAVQYRATCGQEIELLFVDGDIVEPKNIGRQLFSSADIGRNKAEVLAARFNAVFGLKIAAMPNMLLEPLRPMYAGHRRILVGAVDNAAARRQLAASLRHWNLWIDCGNHEYAGQVLVGSTQQSDVLRQACTVPGICAALPSPDLVAPDLLVDPVVIVQPEDCAEAVENNRQSLMINQMIATIAAQYLTSLLLRGQITSFETLVDLSSLSMRSTPITAATIAPYGVKNER